MIIVAKDCPWWSVCSRSETWSEWPRIHWHGPTIHVDGQKNSGRWFRAMVPPISMAKNMVQSWNGVHPQNLPKLVSQATMTSLDDFGVPGNHRISAVSQQLVSVIAPKSLRPQVKVFCQSLSITSLCFILFLGFMPQLCHSSPSTLAYQHRIVKLWAAKTGPKTHLIGRVWKVSETTKLHHFVHDSRLGGAGLGRSKRVQLCHHYGWKSSHPASTQLAPQRNSPTSGPVGELLPSALGSLCRPSISSSAGPPWHLKWMEAVGQFLGTASILSCFMLVPQLWRSSELMANPENIPKSPGSILKWSTSGWFGDPLHLRKPIAAMETGWEWLVSRWFDLKIS